MPGEVWPVLRAMLRDGRLIRIAQKQCSEAGRPFWVHPDDLALLHAGGEARDEILVDVVMKALVSFKRRALIAGRWDPDYDGPRGASCLPTYFVGQCVWELRSVYTAWAKERQRWAKHHSLYARPQEAAGANRGLLGSLEAAGYLEGPEAAVLSTAFEDILDEQQPVTQAVVRLTVHGYTDTEIANKLRLTHGAVRMRKTRFRNALYDAARQRRIWIPEQLHTTAARTRSRQGAR